MRELVDAEQVGKLFLVLAVALPALGIGVGLWYGRREGRRRGALYGSLVGLIGPLNLILWRVYNGITDAVGLDTVRNLVINLVLFVVVGALIGVGAGFAIRRSGAAPITRQPTDEAE
jgi:uncharacterized membrane protein